jgi:hypothetical protein
MPQWIKERAKKALTQPENKVFKQLPTMFERHIKVFKELGFTVDLSQPDFLKSNFEPRNSSGNWRKNQKLIGIAPLHNTMLKCILQI